MPDRAAFSHLRAPSRQASSQALGEIISADREQIALAQSLRQAVAATQAQLRGRSLRAGETGGGCAGSCGFLGPPE